MRARAIILVCAAALMPPSVVATAAAPGRDTPAFLVVGLGAYEVPGRADAAADLRIEYRSPRRLWVLRPWIGAEATSDSALYGAGGLLFEIDLKRHWIVTISEGAGLYHEGDGRDLGHLVEFRSQIEAAYRRADGARLALALSHISNAGLGDHNPGAEMLTFYYSFRLGMAPAPRRAGARRAMARR